MDAAATEKRNKPSEPVTPDEWYARQDAARAWFADLRDRICAAFEAIEDDYTKAHPEAGEPGRFGRKAWDRPDGGGGVMSIMHGTVFEKVGGNISTVEGEFSEKFQGPDTGYYRYPDLLGQRDFTGRASAQPVCSGGSHEHALPQHRG